MDIQKFWDAVLRQDADAIREYFHPDAWVNWYNTNEHFTVEEFIRANCEYPGEWDGEVERVITTDTHIITATHVYSKDGSMSCHATSFIRVVDETFGGSLPGFIAAFTKRRSLTPEEADAIRKMIEEF